MFRRLVLVVSQGRNTILFAEEGGLFCPTTLPIHRAAVPGGQKSLGTSVAVRSEIKDGPELPEQEQKEDGGEKDKSGKENLLELLGSMKVKVTSKKKVWDSKVKRKEPMPRPAPTEMESTTSMFQKAMADLPPQSEESLSPDLVAAASAAASSLPNPQKAKSELLKQLRRHEALPEAQRKGDGNSIGSIIADMKVGKRTNFRQNDRPANQIRFDDDGRGYTYDRSLTSESEGAGRRKGLFGEKRLNIFSPVSEKTEPESAVTVPTLSLWDLELANQIASATNTLPRNGFEEMIQWTKDGKLWEYPIDNEAGLEEEASVPFHEHIFLEKHLEEGFPSQGPVRHFMELVVVGLSKNPHLTAREKVEHIAWFRQYFEQKEDVLREAEAYLN
ncbi:28S ribosomal protein S31, mitochondrial [Anguilla anguilla]|uniref:28S ribosomal protein S31, mitochondrial n=1 Tax=Anguilla anguilla TaxID=7936 RepID=UPI0015ABE598|nr:28S ribosomal protein S31, mitochondrial [Anguilla anguilla]